MPITHGHMSLTFVLVCQPIFGHFCKTSFPVTVAKLASLMDDSSWPGQPWPQIDEFHCLLSNQWLHNNYCFYYCLSTDLMHC